MSEVGFVFIIWICGFIAGAIFCGLIFDTVRPYGVTFSEASEERSWACYRQDQKLVCAPFDVIERRLHGGDDQEETSL